MTVLPYQYNFNIIFYTALYWLMFTKILLHRPEYIARIECHPSYSCTFSNMRWRPLCTLRTLPWSFRYTNQVSLRATNYCNRREKALDAIVSNKSELSSPFVERVTPKARPRARTGKKNGGPELEMINLISRRRLNYQKHRVLWPLTRFIRLFARLFLILPPLTAPLSIIGAVSSNHSATA